MLTEIRNDGQNIDCGQNVGRKVLRLDKKMLKTFRGQISQINTLCFI